MGFVISGIVSTPLHDAANQAAAALPLVGAPSARTEIYLCHFSANPDIQAFRGETLVCNWANGFSVSAKRIAQITSINNVQALNSLYVIRVGIDEDFPPENSPIIPTCHAKYGVFEVALAMDVQAGSFTRIPIVYDQQTGDFS